MKKNYLLLFSLVYITHSQAMLKEKTAKEELQLVLKNVINYENWPEVQLQMRALIDSDNTLVDTSRYDGGGYTPLCYALDHDDYDFAEFLLKNGADSNQSIKGAHVSHPLFLAKSIETAQLLQKYQARIDIQNEGPGITNGMNLLHAAINGLTEDDRLFDYFLKQNIDPNSLNNRGGNLWDSFVYASAPSCPEKRLMARASLLKTLNISPLTKNANKESAADIINKKIEIEAQLLDPEASEVNKVNQPCRQEHIELHNKLTTFLNFMLHETQ